jgi:hypothetical protein
MIISPRAALIDVELATQARRRSDADAEAARSVQAQAIKAALQAGAAVADIAERTGMTRARIYQIRMEV